MEKRQYELGHAPVGRLFLKYTTPAMVAMLVNSTYQMVDAIFVGHGVGPDALGSFTVTFPIQMFALAVAQVIGIGAASVISRSLGAGDTRRAERAAGVSFVSVILLALVLTVLGLSFLRPLLRLFGATEGIFPYAADFMSIMFAGSIFYVFAVSSNSIARAEGNTKLAMYSMILGALVNLTLDPIFIFVFHWGISGAAIATVTANVCACLFLIRYFLSGKSLLRVRASDLRLDKDILLEIVAVGMSNFTRVAAGSIVAIIINNSIAHYGTDTHFAIMGAFNRILLFFLMPLFGFAQGFQPIIGFNYGARNMARVKEIFAKGSLLSSALTTFAFAMMMIFPRQLLLCFSTDQEFLQTGVPILRIIVLFLPFIGFQVIGATFFQALGNWVASLFLSICRQVLFLVPLVLVLPLYFRHWGIWVSIPIADALSVAVTAVWVAIALRAMDRAIAATDADTSPEINEG